MAKLFGTDGIRGIAYDFLDENLSFKVGSALGAILSNNNKKIKVVIGYDTRESKDMISSAIASGLNSFGCDVYTLGVVPTPAVAYITANYGFDAGVMISASHNPYEYNGIKIFGQDGKKLTDEEEEKIEALIKSDISPRDSVSSGAVIPSSELRDKYIEYLSKFAPLFKSEILAVIDCANGSASATARQIFSDLGMKTLFIGCEPNGKNINLGCGSTKLNLLKDKVLEARADIGMAFDGDADRFLAIDEKGNEIDGDYIMAILSIMMREESKLASDTVVGTVMTNYGFTQFAKDNAINFVPTKVGDRYVLEEMEAKGYSLGGEQSGHVIIREAATTGDGQLTALYLLKRMAQTGKSLSELAKIMQKYPQHMINITASSEQKEKIKNAPEIQAVIEDAKQRLGDSGRILVRPSGTEPVVRIMVESKDEALTYSLTEEVSQKIKNLI